MEPIFSGNTQQLQSLCAERYGIDESWKSTVTFATPLEDPEKLPVPSRTYLEIHAACCRVAILSAASEYIDTIWRDMDDIYSLS